MKTQHSDIKYIRAKNRVEKVKRFYYHVVVYIIVNLVITGFKVSNNLNSWEGFINDIISFDVLSSWTIWGLVLVIHALSLVFGQGWEERKIDALMNEELSKNSKNNSMEKYNIEPYENDDEVSNFRKEEAYLRAKKKVDAIVGFYWHLAVYVIVNLFLIIIIGVNAGFSGFGPYATATFWGIGLMFHFLGVFGPNFFLGKDWESKKIDEFMEKEKQRWE